MYGYDADPMGWVLTYTGTLRLEVWQRQDSGSCVFVFRAGSTMVAFWNEPRDPPFFTPCTPHLSSIRVPRYLGI